jgi:hypothetical protein
LLGGVIEGEHAHLWDEGTEDAIDQSKLKDVLWGCAMKCAEANTYFCRVIIQRLSRTRTIWSLQTCHCRDRGKSPKERSWERHISHSMSSPTRTINIQVTLWGA